MTFASSSSTEQSASCIKNFLQSATGWWTVLTALVVVLLIPLALTDFPPVLDYPNHLARLFVLAHAGTAPVLDRMYQPHWAIIPDLAIDIIGPPLINLFGVFPAGKIVLALSLLAPLAGALTYSRLVFRERLYWPMTAALISYNLFFVLGFMNYLLAVGGALAAAGLWIRLAKRRFLIRALTGAASACILFFVHAFGVAFFGLLVGAAELHWLVSDRRDGAGRTRRMLNAGSLLLAAFAGPALLWWLTPHPPHPVTYGYSWIGKLLYFFSPFLSYRDVADMIAALGFLTVTLFILTRSSTRRAPGLAVAIGILFVCFLIVPFSIDGAAFVDSRIPLMIALALCAGLRPAPAARRAGPAVPAFVVLAFLSSFVPVARIWAAPNVQAKQVEASIAPIPPGSRVLVAMPQVKPREKYWMDASPRIIAAGGIRIDYHLPALLLIERRAFWPLLFSDPSQHPIVVRKPYKALSVPLGVPPDLPSLVARKSLIPHWPAPYLKNWPANFDYLLVIDAGAIPNLARFMPDRLKLLNVSHFCALFRIRHQPAPDSGSKS